MTKGMLLSALLGALIAPCMAHNTSTYGTINAAGGASCTSRSCVYLQVPIMGQTSTPGPAPWITVNVSGTWSGALQVVSITSPYASYQNLNSQPWHSRRDGDIHPGAGSDLGERLGSSDADSLIDWNAAQQPDPFRRNNG